MACLRCHVPETFILMHQSIAFGACACRAAYGREPRASGQDDTATETRRDRLLAEPRSVELVFPESRRLAPWPIAGTSRTRTSGKSRKRSWAALPPDRSVSLRIGRRLPSATPQARTSSLARAGID